MENKFNIMKKSLFILLFPIATFSQTLDNSAINSGGNVNAQGNYKLSYSIGGVSVSTKQNNSFLLTEDFQQPYFGSVSLVENELSEITAFPSLVTNKLTIKGEITQNASFIIYDINGKIVVEKQGLATGYINKTIPFDLFSKGLYLLKIISSSGKVKSTKLVKM
jgi:hypothetical protein